MLVYNKILENLIIPVGDILFGTSYIRSLKKWRKIQSLSEAELIELSSQKRNRILKHAIKNIPYYKEIGMEGVSDIMNFPILTKALIKEHIDKLLWHPEKKNSLICEKSSGSSGIQGQVYMSRKEQSNVQAVQTLLWEWSGYKIGMPLLQTGMTLKRGLAKSAKDFFFRTNYQSAFGLAEDEILERLLKLRGKKNGFFGGYASSLYVYAKIAEKNSIHDISFESVISWGDKMFGHYRSLIEKQFSSRVYDTYGTTEGFMLAAQKDSEYYYIISPHVFVEIVDDLGQAVPDGEIGHVLVTSLDAFEMPLIRYRLGDLAMKLPKSEYPDDRELNFPMFKLIIGRDTDIVKTHSGKSMIVHFFTGIFEHFPTIRQFRVVQHALDAMTIEYIPESNFEMDTLDAIRKIIHQHLAEEFPILFQEVKTIPSTPSGKPQIILSTLKSSHAN